MLAQSSNGKSAKQKSTAKARRSSSKVPGARYLGQDGHDLVGTENALGGNDIQDMHIELVGVPTGKTIVWLVVKGLGGGEWVYNGPEGPWHGVQIVQEKGETVADLFLEPYDPENGRLFEIHYRLDDGRTIDLNMQAGKADSNLRIPGAGLKAKWMGQDGGDNVGIGPSVGPDGFQDAKISLEHISTKSEVDSLVISIDGKPVWESGMNLHGYHDAQLQRRGDERSKADLYIASERDLSGKKLSMVVRYQNNKTDRTTLVAGKFDPSKKAPLGGKTPTIRSGLSAKWLGQDGKSPKNPHADAHVSVSGVPPQLEVVAAGVGDGVFGEWFGRLNDQVQVHVEPYTRPLVFVRSSRDKVEVFFPPDRDETKTRMTVRLVFSNGSTMFGRFEGGSCDLERLTPPPPSGSVDAKPGDDLASLAARFGTIRLLRNTTYAMAHPLVLERAVTIKGEPGSTILFTQKPNDEPWSAAVKIHASKTTLEGFAIRFTGPVRWRQGIDNGPAVIGSTDNADPPPKDIKMSIVIHNLDIESPPAASEWEEAPRLIRLPTSTSGEISGNTLKGGTIEFKNGPWKIVDNNYLGAPPGAYNYAVFSCRRVHDVEVSRNKARQTFPKGKTWRFLVLSDSAHNDLIGDNDVAGIGPRDGESYPNMNAPEVVLTESYKLRFEGKPLAVSADGMLVRIPKPQGEQPRAGDAVAVLTGAKAGSFGVISQVLEPSTFLLSSPLPKTDGDVISIAEGFVGDEYVNNTIDCRDGSVAATLVFVGNHFGTVVKNNHLIGRGNVFLLTAAPTEAPMYWGWSHAPFLGVVVEGNTFEDTLRGGKIAVEHSSHIKSNKGRRYLSIELKDNTFEWTSGYFSKLGPNDRNKPLLAAQVGDEGSLDLDELVVQESRTTLKSAGKPARFVVSSAVWNDRELKDKSVPFGEHAAAKSNKRTK